MIKKSSIEALKIQINIVDIIDSTIELKKYGANFKACCPFHGEDTPSFVVSPVKQIYHCFGCGAGGDALKFVQEYNRLTFQEAVEKIASDMNFTLEYEAGAVRVDYQAIMQSVSSFYQAYLREDKLQYLLDRGITQKSINKFEIGYAPRNEQQLQLARDNLFNLQEMIDTGLFAQDNDKIYARLRERITFPIRNQANKLIGFGGRTIRETKDIAKYLNSPQTKLFNKSRSFYGFNLAKEHIYKHSTMVITEGYLDVVMMHQAGINTTVATMGTALTQQHIPIIKKTNCKVILCFDGDNAGRVAAYKASVLLSQHQIDGGVVLFADGVDPADMVRNKKIEELHKIMEKPIPLIEYAISFIVGGFDLTNPHNKNQALAKSVAFLKTINLLIAEEYKGYLAKKLGIASHHITLGQVRRNEQPVVKPSNTSNADEKLLKTLIEKPQFIELLMNRLDYQVYEHNAMFQSILDSEKDSEILRPLVIRDDIIIYNMVDFIQACKLKQVSYLSNELKKLSVSLDDNVFEKMDHIHSRLNQLR